MKILIAEDDPISRHLLQTTLTKWNYDVTVCTDGAAALEALQAKDAPNLAILDWMMPILDGVTVCQRLRAETSSHPIYIILLTAKTGRIDIVTGLQSGADDYLTKPFDREELRARLQVGSRIVELQQTLSARVNELEDALSRVKQLEGMVPICAWCKKIRDDSGYWNQLEEYIEHHSGAEFSHGICPSCVEQHYPSATPKIESVA